MNSTSLNRKMVTTGLLVVVLLLILMPVSRKTLFESHFFHAIDSTAIQYVDESLVRAGSAFAIARTFNAIVSVFQESQLQLEPGGVGVSLALGASLDPANDLVERFSWVMLASLTSIGVQKVLLEITPFVSIQIVLSLAVVFLLVGVWRPCLGSCNFVHIGKVLLFAAILLRFAVPLMAYLNNQVYVAFLEQRYDQSVESLGETVAVLEKYQLEGMVKEPGDDTSVEEAGRGWWDNALSTVKKTVDQGAKMLDIGERLESIKLATLDLIDRIVDLIVVFVLNTIVLPLLFLWGLLKLGRLLFGRAV